MNLSNVKVHTLKISTNKVTRRGSFDPNGTQVADCIDNVILPGLNDRDHLAMYLVYDAERFVESFSERAPINQDFKDACAWAQSDRKGPLSRALVIAVPEGPEQWFRVVWQDNSWSVEAIGTF